ncbi:MAG: Trigger factor [Parcubacteria group bacterium GW2011_GWC1_43_11b]|uniref:Trigger factor n=1 Tax=Candidatus Vogelbacteria bacterium RIFOXYB1_FULL_42_16 TaxID=1802436 RepID=A0A1G2QBJ8_9BACT|nr:MAG: Trigger factor [Parcubacteria group bacterium GW2011_GWC1_43_11b]OHA57930.1 MAG: hypothetical protein A2370_02035 [Candidatus Vogelbacteria bacterium RIFOXYB1_FULL_42_16]
MSNQNWSIKITKLPQAEVEIEVEITEAFFSTYRSKALKTLNENLKVDGFRAGHIPEKTIVEKVGDEHILFEMAELVIKDVYPKIVAENNLDVIGRPEITITKIATGNPLGLKIKTAIVPTVELPDYQTIATKLNTEPAETIEVTAEDVTKALEEIRQHTSHQHHEHNPPAGGGDKLSADAKGSGETKPELNDDFAKSLGKFDSLADLKTKLRASIKMEKEMRAKEKRRLKIVTEIQQKAKFELSPVLIENELQKMIGELEMQISQAGLAFDDYLTHLKKTRDDLKKDWRQDAEKRVGFGLTLEALAKAEKITAPEEELQKETDFLVIRYPEASPEQLRNYAQTVITHEKTFQFLENLK